MRINREEINAKKNFINRHTDYMLITEESFDKIYLYKDYGFEGKNCIFVGNLSEYNNYLNRLLRKHFLVEEWKEEKKRLVY